MEKLARLNSRYVAPAGAEKPEAAGKASNVFRFHFHFSIFMLHYNFFCPSQVGLAAIRDLAAAQEAALLGKPQPSLGEDEVSRGLVNIFCN